MIQSCIHTDTRIHTIACSLPVSVSLPPLSSHLAEMYKGGQTSSSGKLRFQTPCNIPSGDSPNFAKITKLDRRSPTKNRVILNFFKKISFGKWRWKAGERKESWTNSGTWLARPQLCELLNARNITLSIPGPKLIVKLQPQELSVVWRPSPRCFMKSECGR